MDGLDKVIRGAESTKSFTAFQQEVYDKVKVHTALALSHFIDRAIFKGWTNGHSTEDTYQMLQRWMRMYVIPYTKRIHSV